MSKIVISFYSDDQDDETLRKARMVISGLIQDLTKMGFGLEHVGAQDKAIGLLTSATLITPPEKRATVRKAQPIEAAPKQRKLI